MPPDNVGHEALRSLSIGRRLDTRFRRPVLRSTGARTRVEAGEGTDVTETGRVALVAQYSRLPIASRSLQELVDQLSDAGYRCVICSTCEHQGQLVWPRGLPTGTVVLRRRNVGYDFGSWAVALDRFPDVRKLDRVILTNDSLLGPFAPISPLLEAFDHARTTVWSLTESFEISHHMQSYFLGFRSGALAREPLRTFLHDVRVERTVWDVVLNYELGLSRLCRNSAISYSSHFPVDAATRDDSNPTIIHWRRLLDRGFPFVKRTLVKGLDPAAVRASDVYRAVSDRFGTDLTKWL